MMVEKKGSSMRRQMAKPSIKVPCASPVWYPNHCLALCEKNEGVKSSEHVSYLGKSITDSSIFVVHRKF